MAVTGYYDGTTIQLLERIIAKPNQKVTITVMDEFIEPDKEKKRNMRGVLAGYANSLLAEKEESAWKRAVVERYGNI